MMADTLTPSQRTRCMAAVRSADTTPERAVRSLLHRLGYRFRLNVRNLPGKPDIVLPRHRAVILVHGCFWHRHRCRRGRIAPRTNSSFWNAKLTSNQRRDKLTRVRLRAAGYRVLTIWECQLRDPERLINAIQSFLGA